MNHTSLQIPLTKEDFLKAMTELRTSLDQRFRAIDQRFDGIDAKLREHDGLFAQVYKDFEILTDVIDNNHLEHTFALNDIRRKIADAAMDTPTLKEFKALEHRTTVLEQRCRNRRIKSN